MKKFLLHISVYVVGILSLMLFLGSFADGNTDDNYRHFTRRASSIIMGDSRGSQAVVPDVLNQNFSGKDFDNFSLNITHSPYGPVYLKALKRKLKPDTNHGIFILTVDPWNLSLSRKTKKIEDFSETKSPLNNVYCYDMDTNYEYLLKNLNHSWYIIYRDRETQGRSNTYLHKNGWLEVTVSMKPEEIAQREREKVQFYKDFASAQQLSEERMKAFEQIIQYLKNYGKVYIVRIPGGRKIMEIEEGYAPQFDSLMKEISQKYAVPYFNFSKNCEQYQYTDGNHMYKESSKIFTQQIADSIKAYQK